MKKLNNLATNIYLAGMNVILKWKWIIIQKLMYSILWQFSQLVNILI